MQQSSCLFALISGISAWPINLGPRGRDAPGQELLTGDQRRHWHASVAVRIA